MMKACFITASGTEIGKTFVLCRLLEGLLAAGRPAAAIKPVISGWKADDKASDTALIRKAHGARGKIPPVDEVSPWRFAAPLSPHIAARREGRRIEPRALVAFCRKKLAAGHDPLLIEGVGGAFVPLSENWTVADWIGALALPALVVVDSRLGALSHGIAACTALRARDVDIAGVVVSQSPDEPMAFAETVASFAAFLPAPIFALPRISEDDYPAAAHALADWYAALARGHAPPATTPSLAASA